MASTAFRDNITKFVIWGYEVITSAQSRAARGLVSWSQSELAEKSHLSESTIRNFEKDRAVPSINNLAAVVRALEKAGVEFIPENGGGPGVRLRKPIPASAHPKPSGPATDVIERMDAEIAANRKKPKP